jgi:prepilin-type N-terminal cleavage/methylation domain-containing protein
VTRDQRGFTLLELLLALAIVGALVVIAFSGVRIALASWRQGEDREQRLNLPARKAHRMPVAHSHLETAQKGEPNSLSAGQRRRRG